MYNLFTTSSIDIVAVQVPLLCGGLERVSNGVLNHHHSLNRYGYPYYSGFKKANIENISF